MSFADKLTEYQPKDIMPDLESQWWKPFAAGAAVVAAGFALTRIRPSALDLPNPTGRGDGASGRVARAVGVARDGADKVAPDNVASQIGRSLVMAGSAMLVARVLDEVMSRQD
ncbi:hypothetical protein [Pseudooceanicola sp. MF1-13]|uniref:hypothetical protein n=1 Tax=Pseudooceanicola sp. MF1-13 TaxID=3379095 RepID=UPI0038921C46